jgi:hypothetical protein
VNPAPLDTFHWRYCNIIFRVCDQCCAFSNSLGQSPYFTYQEHAIAYLCLHVGLVIEEIIILILCLLNSDAANDPQVLELRRRDGLVSDYASKILVGSLMGLS